jgi:DNA-binding NarL/FixJ family response regulator
MITVVVGEDSFLVREGMVHVLARDERIDVVGEASDFDALLALVDEKSPQVVVTDIRMPPTGTDEGIRVALELARSHPEVGVVVLSQHAQITYANALFAGGNPRRAYLIKDRIAGGELLVEAVDSVARGVPMLDPEIVGMLIDAGRGQKVGLARLNEREEQVLGLVAEGASNGAIAERLGLTTRSVERQVNSIFTKLDLGHEEAYNRRVLAALLYVRSQA